MLKMGGVTAYFFGGPTVLFLSPFSFLLFLPVGPVNASIEKGGGPEADEYFSSFFPLPLPFLLFSLLQGLKPRREGRRESITKPPSPDYCALPLSHPSFFFFFFFPPFPSSLCRSPVIYTKGCTKAMSFFSLPVCSFLSFFSPRPSWKDSLPHLCRKKKSSIKRNCRG